VIDEQERMLDFECQGCSFLLVLLNYAMKLYVLDTHAACVVKLYSLLIADGIPFKATKLEPLVI
jgi:hypothetical protein